MSASDHVKITNQHGSITIVPVQSDTIEIEISISADIDILTDSAYFFNSIDFKLNKTGKTVFAETLVLFNFQYPIPYQVDYIIYAPDSLIWDISNKFGDVKSAIPLQLSRCNMEYGKFNIPSLLTKSTTVTQCSFIQCTLTTDTLGACILKSQNSTLNIAYADDLVVRTEFSNLNFGTLINSNVFSYTDHIDICRSYGLKINSNYSDLILRLPEGDLFAEMSFGKLLVNNISAEARALNFDLNKVENELLVDQSTFLLINAEMKYCDFNSSEISNSLKQIKDGSNKTYNGKWGNKSTKDSPSILTIVSKFENIELRLRQ